VAEAKTVVQAMMVRLIWGEVLVKTSESSDSQWRRLDLRVPLVPVDIPADKDREETTEWMADLDFRVFQVLRVLQDKPRLQLTWTPFRPSLLKETKLEVEPLALDSYRLKWVPWDLVDPQALPAPLERLDLSVLAVTPEIRVRSDNADPEEQSDQPVQPEKRENLDVTVNLDARVLVDQWANADLQECRDFQAPKDTGDCLELMELRDLRANKDSLEIWENLVRWVLLALWVPVVLAESVAVSVPLALQVFVEATVFPVLAVPPALSDPLDPQESPASPDPKETRDSKDLREAEASKVLVEKTGCPDHQESPEFKEPQVWTDLTGRRDPEEIWVFREHQDSRDQEDRPVLPETPVWADPRVFRVNLVSRVFAV